MVERASNNIQGKLEVAESLILPKVAETQSLLNDSRISLASKVSILIEYSKYAGMLSLVSYMKGTISAEQCFDGPFKDRYESPDALEVAIERVVESAQGIHSMLEESQQLKS